MDQEALVKFFKAEIRKRDRHILNLQEVIHNLVRFSSPAKLDIPDFLISKTNETKDDFLKEMLGDS